MSEISVTNKRERKKPSCDDPSHQSKKKTDPSPVEDYFINHEFIAPLVVQFLGVRSLIRFSMTNKMHNKEVLSNEIARRKQCIAVAETEVKDLLGNNDPEFVPLREDVEKAKKISEDTLRLIDDEINLHDRIGIHEFQMIWDEDDSEDEEVFFEEDFFLEERKKFLLKNGFENKFASLVVLPMNFYCSPTIDPEEVSAGTNNNENEIIQAQTDIFASGILHLVPGLIGDLYDYMHYKEPTDWARLDYEQPFEKFYHPIPEAQSLRDLMIETAKKLASSSNIFSIDAFRIAARKRVYRTPYPYSRDCLWFILAEADRIQAGDHYYSDTYYEERILILS